MARTVEGSQGSAQSISARFREAGESSYSSGIGGWFADELADLEDECFDVFDACGEAGSGEVEPAAADLTGFIFFLGGKGSGDEERDAESEPLDGFLCGFFFGAGEAAGESESSAPLAEGT